MSPKTWYVSPDGKFEIVSMTAATVEGGLDVIRNSFFKNENVSTALEVDKDEGSKKELEDLCITASKDGVSLVAIEKATGKVAAVAFNKMQVKVKDGELDFYENFKKNCKHDSSKALIQFMHDVDITCNIYNHYKIDCLLEVMFLATLKEYRGKGLGKQLCASTVEMGKMLLNGDKIKVPVDDKYPVSYEPRPKAVAAVFTSFITQRIGRTLNWDKLSDVHYEKFIYKGQTYFSKIGHHTPSTTLEAIYLLK